MENENKKKIKRKFIQPITDEDLYSYNYGSENLSPNIKALPGKKRYDAKKDLRPIEINMEKACQQKKLILSGIEVFFPYEPYPNQKIYMEKVIEACKKNTIAGLESPTGTGKTLCLLCASLAYLRHERQRLIEERENNFDVIDKTEKIKQPVIYYTSRTHAQLTNVIQELQKTCYKPINSIITSRDQMCINSLLGGFKGNSLTMRCQIQIKTHQCKFFKGKSNLNATWGSYDGKTIDELKEIAKKAKFCPFFFERDKSIHSDLIFLPYNYIFDPAIKKKMNIQMKNSILIIDEAHNIQDVCNDSVSKDFDTFMIDEILKELKGLKNQLEENNGVGELNLERGLGDGKNSKNLNFDPINLEQLKYEINILNNIKNTLLGFKVQSGDKWPNFGMKLDGKGFFDLFYLGSRGDSEKQTTIKFNNNNLSNNKLKVNRNKPPESNNKISGRKSEAQISEKTHKSDSNVSYDDYEENLSEEEFNLNNEQIEPELTPNNIQTHIDHLNSYEFLLSSNNQKSNFICHYIDILELIKLLSDNYIEVETSDDTNPLHNYINNFRFFIEDVQENMNKNYNLNFNQKKKPIFNYAKQKKRVLHIYCFNPGFGFKKIINEQLHSMIITSGTLSPIDGMESELKCSFDVKLEGTHVIDKRQVHFGILTSSLFNKNEEFLFNAVNRNNIQMINNLGKTIVELCKVTPGGILCFFGSYGVMEDFIKKWEKAKIISEISKYKEFCQDKHDQKLNKAVLDLYQKANSTRERKGAILFSVCRGSCSEGMNFKNDAARLVIVVGIPFAYLGDPKTQLRKEYQDQFNKLYYAFIKDKNIKKLSGSEWYNQNALKCVNQALGRVIRHSNDYGCMILIDSRYQHNNNRCLISKWIRDQSIIYNNKNNDRLISNVEKFFIEAESFTNKKIEEQKKLLSEQKMKDMEKVSSKKTKKGFDRMIKIIQDDDDFMDEEEKNYNDEIIKSSLKKIKKKNNLIRLNDDQHFNIINDIKIDEIKNSSNNQREKLKRIKKLQNSNKENNSNQSNPFLENNFDLKEIFGDDIKINESEKKQKDLNNQNNNNNLNKSTNITKEPKNEDQISPFPDIFNDLGVSFFDDLKDAKNTTIKKDKPTKKEDNNEIINDDNTNKKVNSINNELNNNDINTDSGKKQNEKESKEKGFTIDQLIEQLVQKKDDSNFKEKLKEKGLNFKIAEGSSKSSDTSVKNIIECPICYKTTEDSNVKMEHLKCGHCFCKECIDKLREKKKSAVKLKCPKCLTKVNIKDITPLYI